MDMLTSFFATNYAFYARRQGHRDIYNPPVVYNPSILASTSPSAMTGKGMENDRKLKTHNTGSNSSKEVKFSIANILSDKPISTAISDEDCINVDDSSSPEEENMEEESGEDPSDMGQFSWLQCTRYKPPKLPRLKKKDGVRKRKLGRNPRVPFTQHQVAMLEQKFRRTHYLSSMDVAELSTALSLTETRVKIWFQNRRARERRDREAAQRGQVTHARQDSGIHVPNPPWVFSSSHSAFVHFRDSLELTNTGFSSISLPK